MATAKFRGKIIYRCLTEIKSFYYGLSLLRTLFPDSPDVMTGQIHFSPVTYLFWLVKIMYKINNSQNRGP